LTTGPADIAEIFSSIQGEGILVGRRQIFVRFFPCNLLCAYCDTPARKADANLCRIEKTPGRKDFFTVPSRVSAESLSSLIDSFEGFSGLHHSISLTGGEPLIKKNVLDLIQMLREIDQLEEISLTTNGFKLKTMAPFLKKAGIDRINISLDTLRKDRFKAITGVAGFEEVWAGVQTALDSGFHCVKLNVIPMKKVNEDEILDFP